MATLRPTRDAELVQIVDAALADATVRSGRWLACRLGCSQCCHGVFAISALDAVRLRDGLALLAESDPAAAARIRLRARASVAAFSQEYPGDAKTGTLSENPQDEARFADFANDEPCPVLDPDIGTCELYTARPLTCRIFGPPVLSAEGLGMCELCFVGATETDMAAGEMRLVHHALEEELTAQAEQATQPGSTIIAFALLQA